MPSWSPGKHVVTCESSGTYGKWTGARVADLCTMMDRFRLSFHFAHRLKAQKVALAAVLLAAQLSAAFFHQERIQVDTAQLFALWRAVGEVGNDPSKNARGAGSGGSCSSSQIPNNKSFSTHGIRIVHRWRLPDEGLLPESY